MTHSTRTVLCLLHAALVFSLGCGGVDDSTEKPAGKRMLSVTPLQVSAVIGESIAIRIRVQLPSSNASGLAVESGEEDVVASPQLADFSQPLPNMDVVQGGGGSYFFSSSGGEDAATFNVTCLTAGFSPVTVTVNLDGESLSEVVEITCNEKPVAGLPTHCLLPFANEFLKGVDPDGKLVDVPGWGKGAALAGAVTGSGSSTALLMAGYAEGSAPALWRSDAFDPAVGAPSRWEPFTVSSATGRFAGVASRGAEAVLASVDVGLYAFSGGVLSAADPTPATTLACDDAGACVTTDVNGGLLRTTDGVSWSPTNGSERYGPLVHCEGVFMAYDAFNNQQLRSTDGGLTWTPGDLSAFNVNSFTCGNGTWVASAQDTTWWSSDAGETWARSTDAVGMVSYSPTGQAFYAAGTGPTFFPTVWRSADGDAWTETDNLGVAGALNNIVCY